MSHILILQHLNYFKIHLGIYHNKLFLITNSLPNILSSHVLFSRCKLCKKYHTVYNHSNQENILYTLHHIVYLHKSNQNPLKIFHLDKLININFPLNMLQVSNMSSYQKFPHIIHKENHMFHIYSKSFQLFCIFLSCK